MLLACRVFDQAFNDLEILVPNPDLPTLMSTPRDVFLRRDDLSPISVLKVVPVLTQVESRAYTRFTRLTSACDAV
jgi:hypothetical protein